MSDADQYSPSEAVEAYRKYMDYLDDVRELLQAQAMAPKAMVGVRIDDPESPTPEMHVVTKSEELVEIRNDAVSASVAALVRLRQHHIENGIDPDLLPQP